MKLLSNILFRKNVVLLTMMLTAIFTLITIDPILIANDKKAKYAKRKKLDAKYNHLKNDYYYQIENFTVLLRKLITLSRSLEEKIIDLEDRCALQEEETKYISNYLYQKSGDQSFCPFELIKHLYQDRIHFHGERAQVAEDSQQEAQPNND